MANTLDFLSEQLTAQVSQVATTKLIEQQADKKIQESVQQEAVVPSIKAASDNIITGQIQLVENSSTIAGLAGEIDAAFKQQQEGVLKASGVKVTTAQAAEQLNAPARTNYNAAVNNPVVDDNIKRYNQQIDVYSRKIQELQSDDSFLGGLKRMTLEGATRNRLNEARQNLASAQGRKISATQTLTASLQGNNLYAQNSTAVARAMIADGIVRADSTMKQLQSGLTVKEADRRTLMDQLQLDTTRLSLYEKEFQYLQQRGLATNQTMAALQIKLSAQQSQEGALKRAKDTDSRLQIVEEWQSFVRDNTPDAVESEKLLKQFPDAFDPTTLNTTVGQTFWKQRGQRGTNNEFAQLALLKRKNNQPLNDADATAVALIDDGTSKAMAAAQAQFELNVTTDRKNRDKYEKELEATLLNLSNPVEQAKFYEASLAGMKNDASQGITAGAIIIPDINQKLTDPNFKYSSLVSDQFKAILTSTDWVANDLGFRRGVDPVAQLQSITSGVVDYLVTTGTKDKLGRMQFDTKTQGLITTVSEGMAGYYNAIHKMNIDSNSGLTSGNLPSLKIGGVGIGGTAMDLMNSNQWEQVIRKMLRTTSGPVTLLDNLFDGTPATRRSATAHIRGIPGV